MPTCRIARSCSSRPSTSTTSANLRSCDRRVKEAQTAHHRSANQQHQRQQTEAESVPQAVGYTCARRTHTPHTAHTQVFGICTKISPRHRQTKSSQAVKQVPLLLLRPHQVFSRMRMPFKPCTQVDLISPHTLKSRLDCLLVRRILTGGRCITELE